MMKNRTSQHPNLLIGTTTNRTVEMLSADRCSNIFEAFAAVKNGPYHAIYVVLSQLPEPKAQALTALSQAAAASTLYLLINMSEEPEAIGLRNAALVKDYFLLPLSSSLSQMKSTPSDVNTFSKNERIRMLEELVTQDDLTGLKNRRYLRQFLPAIINAAKESNTRVTLLLFDLDNFKHYNDTFGHSTGDTVLAQTARLIRRCCREHDVVVRLGGDEFAVIFWDLPEERPNDDRRHTSQDHPRKVRFMAERFCAEMSQAEFECLGHKGKGKLTISGGLATYPVDAKTAEALFEKADHAMLEAKRSGKNKITIVGVS